MNIVLLNNAQIRYRALWKLIQSGEGDSPTADSVRDDLDTLWKECSQEERNLLDKFCVEMRDYTPIDVATQLLPVRDKYLAKFRLGQSETWIPDKRTEQLFLLSNFLIDELKSILPNDDDRIKMQRLFNRKARGTEDLFELAANVLTDALQGRIDNYKGRG